MTAAAVLLVLLLLDGALAALLLRRGRGYLPAAAVAAGLAYDAGVLAAGAVAGPGAALVNANAGRYVVHAVLTPLLLPVAVRLARPGAGPGRTALVAAWAGAAALVVLGLVQEVAGLRLVPHPAAGLLRYVPAEADPPVAAIVVTLLVLAAGVLRWRRGGGRALAVAAAVCLVLSGAMGVTDPPVLGGVAETVLLAGVAVAAATGGRPARAAPVPVPAAGPIDR